MTNKLISLAINNFFYQLVIVIQKINSFFLKKNPLYLKKLIKISQNFKNLPQKKPIIQTRKNTKKRIIEKKN